MLVPHGEGQEHCRVSQTSAPGFASRRHHFSTPFYQRHLGNKAKLYETGQRLARSTRSPMAPNEPEGTRQRCCVRAEPSHRLAQKSLAVAPRSANSSNWPVILVVEDEVLVREMIVQYLRDRYFIILEAESAE